MRFDNNLQDLPRFESFQHDSMIFDKKWQDFSSFEEIWQDLVWVFNILEDCSGDVTDFCQQTQTFFPQMDLT